METILLIAPLGDCSELGDQELPGGVSTAIHMTAGAVDTILATAIDQWPALDA